MTPHLELIARRAAGSMRDSQSLLEQVLSFSDGQFDRRSGSRQMLGTADDERLHATLPTAMAESRRGGGDEAARRRESMPASMPGGLAEQLLGYFRDLMAVTLSAAMRRLLRHTSASLHPESLGELSRRTNGDCRRFWRSSVWSTKRSSAYSTQRLIPEFCLEATLIQICHLPDLQCN